MALEGLDPEVVTQLAGQLKTQSQDIGGVIAHVDGIVNRIDQSWHGHTASEFAGWWRQQHRPALVEAQIAVDGLHQSALNNVAQQEQASGDIPSSGGSLWDPLLRVDSIAYNPIARFMDDAHKFSDKAGWLVGPFIGAASPMLDKVMKVDQIARFGQDVWQGNFLPHGGGALSGNGSNAFDELANVGGTFSYLRFSTVGFLLDVNDRVWQGVGDAASAIDWHDMNAINPFSPTSGYWGSYGISSGSFWSDIYHSEATGLGTVAMNIIKDTTGGLIGKIF